MLRIKKFLIFVFFTFLFISCSRSKEFSEVKTFTFYSVDLVNSQPFTDLTAKELTKKSGVFLETLCNQSDDDISIMIANDSYPDLIYAKSDLSKLIEAGAVIPLDDLIQKYGNNMKKLYGNQLQKLKYSVEDSHIYTVGTFDIKNKVLEAAGNIQLQNAVLSELGYPKIETLDELEDALLVYKSKYPKINGHDTIGFSLLCDDWFWYLGLSNPGGYLIGLPDDGQWYVNQNTLEAQYKFLHPDMPIFYKWLNKIYHEGLLDIESFTQKEDVYQSKLSEGYVLATSYTLWGLQDSRKKLHESNMDSRVFAYLPVTAGLEYKDPALKDYGFSGGWGVAITKSCKDPEGAFQFLDYLCSEEAQIILNWGIENVTYYKDLNGRRVEKKEIPLDSGVGVWTYPFPQAGKGALDSLGNNICQLSEEKIRREYFQSEKDTLNAYGVSMWTDLFPTSEELGVSKHGQVWQYNLSTENQEKLKKIDDFVKQSLIHMILGDTRDFDLRWTQMTEEIVKKDIESVTIELNSLISQKMSLWEN